MDNTNTLGLIVGFDQVSQMLGWQLVYESGSEEGGASLRFFPIFLIHC